MRESQERCMSHAVDLRLDRLVDDRMVVPVYVRPDGRVPIEVLVPVLVPQPATLAPREHHRLMLARAPLAHGREGMPHEDLVEGRIIRGSHAAGRSIRLSTCVFTALANPARL